jgi:hypothetical protein
MDMSPTAIHISPIQHIHSPLVHLNRTHDTHDGKHQSHEYRHNTGHCADTNPARPTVGWKCFRL